MNKVITPKQYQEMQRDLLEHAAEHMVITKQVTGGAICVLTEGIIKDAHVAVISYRMKSKDAERSRKLLADVNAFIAAWEMDNATEDGTCGTY